MSSDPLTQFRAAIERAGITPPDHVIADGALHRFAADGTPGDDAGWYVLHADDIPAGAYGDWRSGISETWRGDIGRTLTPDEGRAHHQRIEQARKQRELAEARHAKDAAHRAAAIWNAAQPAAADHPYLAGKGVQPYGGRVHRGPLTIGGMDIDAALVLPLRDVTGELQSVEFISGDGEKRYLPGGRVSGCYASIGQPTDVMCIAEGYATAASVHHATGYATAASVHHATGYATACATSAGNLLPVARALREKFPAARIVIAADDDYQTTGNPGLSGARLKRDMATGTHNNRLRPIARASACSK